jgi:(p)ppGpp synthase/HD superfamily hydrolase
LVIFLKFNLLSCTTSFSPMLAHAIALAAAAHEHQRDRSGKPYILHPLRIMAGMETEEEMTVAMLHDLVEDTTWTLDELRAEGFSEAVVQAVDCLTKREDEQYSSLINRAKQSPLAVRVKLGDLEDNMNTTRLDTFTEEDAERLKKYHAAWMELRTFAAAGGKDVAATER